MSIVQKITNIVKTNNFSSLMGNGFMAVFGLVSFMILARNYSKESFGTWVLYITGFAFIEMLKAGVLHSALVKFLSGRNEEEKRVIKGSSWLIGIILSIIIFVLVYFTGILFPDFVEKNGLTLFFYWYPWISLVIIPFNYAQWIFQSENKFNSILKLRLLNSIGLLGLFGFCVWKDLSMDTIALCHLLIHLLSSVVLVLTGSSGIQFLFKGTKKDALELLHFGKYSIGTLIGTNLLKSADTIIIGFFLGPIAVATYSIPLKLTEAIEVPLRSFVATALPKMSAFNNKNQNAEVRRLFYQSSGVLTIVFIPALILAFVFAEQLVVLLGGAGYADSALIFRIFTIYGVFLAIDRYTGVTLDALNQPKYNLYKVLMMVTANILGDLIVMKIWGELWAVAAVTILNVIVGVFIGYFYLNKILKISFLDNIKVGFSESIYFLKKMIRT